MRMPLTALVLSIATILLALSCTTPGGIFSSESSNSDCTQNLASNDEWSNEVEIQIDGYSANAMEPKISADESVLYWNDKPASDDEMNLHYAIRQSPGRYLYRGTLSGTVAPKHLDGVPALDTRGNFYFVSTRSYSANFQTLYTGKVEKLDSGHQRITNVVAADQGVSAKKLGTVDMDIDVSWDGTLLIVSRAIFSGRPFPDASQLQLFKVSNGTAALHSEATAWLQNVNRPECRVYAGTLSGDKKELYYTILPAGSRLRPDDFRILVSKRESLKEAFGPGAIISGIKGEFIEGPSLTLADGGKSLYYHRREPKSERFKIYKVSRK